MTKMLLIDEYAESDVLRIVKHTLQKGHPTLFYISKITNKYLPLEAADLHDLSQGKFIEKPTQLKNGTHEISIKDIYADKTEANKIFSIIQIKATEKPMHETERSTMLKLILGMAIEAYGYDPKSSRNSATGGNKESIKARLEKIGFKVDEGTIRKHLKNAEEIL